MSEQQFRCPSCRELKKRRTPDQRYCGKPACQRARKSAWRRSKYATDPDYRANHRDSTRAWFQSQGGSAAYFRSYRKRGSVDGSQAQQSATAEPLSRSKKHVPSVAAQFTTDSQAEAANLVSESHIVQPPSGMTSDASTQALRPGSDVTGSAKSDAPGSAKGDATGNAKSDAVSVKNLITSGKYRVSPLGGAKSDAVLVELSVISGQ